MKSRLDYQANNSHPPAAAGVGAGVEPMPSIGRGVC